MGTALALLYLHFFSSGPAGAVTAAAESGPCSLDNAIPATVAAINGDFDLLLDDGRRAALSGLEFPPPAGEKGGKDMSEAARKRLSDWLAGRDIFIGALASGPDRWGRAPARAYAPAGEGAAAPIVSVGAALLEEGLARFRPDPPATPCANEYRAAEASAREASRGLWAEAAARPVSTGEGVAASLHQRKGMIILEGKIRSVGESKAALYLNFGQKRADNASVVVLRRNLAILQSSGIDPRALVGRMVRVRGLVEAAFGPRIEISSPAEIEILEPAAP
ncbi:MAG: nuclease [Hyphomicrobiales bacterium]|nr:MAG: nuclease [Hyphomicrobiales bacterium]